jgi:type II secretory pathway predicted ATPase ExeA
MFLDFYAMKEQPFGVTPDPRFLYLGKSHREALASLYYAIESERGFAALVAQPGLGKTTLAFQLLEKLQRNCRTVFLFHTQCNSKELMHYLLNGLGVDAESMDVVSMHNRLNLILSRELLAGRRFVLAIDEAQNLEPEVLETIRLLSNFETSRTKLLQILLIGQPQLARKLARPELEQLQQRISLFARIEPFGAEDTARYISHRLQVAGYTGAPLFSPAALRLIAAQSNGIPRSINRLCFSALSLGCALGRKQVGVDLLAEVLADQDLESLERPAAARNITLPPAAPKSTPAPSRPARPSVISYPPTSQRSFGKWMAGTAGVAAVVAIVIGMLSLSPERIDRVVQASSGAWTALRNAAASVRSTVSAKSESGADQASELANLESVHTASASGGAEFTAVVVQPGDTLRQIVLRTSDDYTDGTIASIRKINPDIADLDHLEAGQAIRIPRATPGGESAPAAHRLNANETNANGTTTNATN